MNRFAKMKKERIYTLFETLSIQIVTNTLGSAFDSKLFI